MGLRHQSPRTIRVVGGMLALVWLAGGAAALVAAVLTSRWLLALAALIALGYGFVWVNVARQGRLLTAREALMSWRLRQRPDA
jgi:hypothetical protein